ncbi:hypothetical protein COLO4_13368 [Corchorus olitorius]|uniref:J domain-containing protein n=1 Tax=Corchorus olitorius TaxID=93759 RepID=A0A1R3JWQ6_9ROSI|nr:hypothetical protein COLO4_13368 [Corchorus olitorius]
MVDVVPKEIEEAKEKISGGDYLGARRILLQLKRDVPALDDISGMLAVCDTLFSASLGFMDCDFYFVLQIPPEATNSDIKASYNKLTVLIEPIANANNFPGAASALRMVQDAYSGLSNPEQRKVFDEKRARQLECYASGILDSEATETLCQTHENSSSCESPKMGCYKAGDDIITDAEVSINLGETQAQSSCLKDCNQDYYNFVNARKRDIYSVGQIWATYDEEGLPRKYARITWIDESSFRLLVSWLNPLRVTAHERKCNLPLATGSFKRGETRLDLDLSRFSHSVNYEKIGEDQSLYRIYPKKGEVWAIYKNFDGSRKPADVNSDQCRIVEIVDFSEKSGIMAVGLIEVPGWKSFFQRQQQQDGYRVSHTVSRKEMIFFSHQVPAHTVEGIHGIPKGSWYVEPDALPLGISTLELSCRSTAIMLY